MICENLLNQPIKYFRSTLQHILSSYNYKAEELQKELDRGKKDHKQQSLYFGISLRMNNSQTEEIRYGT